MASITSGTHTFGEVLQAASFDFTQAGGDHRRVIVAKLGMDSLDDTFVIPRGAPSVDIQFDGDIVATLTVVDPPE